MPTAGQGGSSSPRLLGSPRAVGTLLLAALLPICTAVSASFSRFASTVSGLQQSMIAQAKAADPAASWTVDEHSRGKAVVIEDGDVWEKGCISVTLIEDEELSATRAAAISARTGTGIATGDQYSACALSFVLHARSPLVPTLRGDVRVFVVGEEEWYGGGLDLTPSYVEAEDSQHFHACLARLCVSHGGPGTYNTMKATCDAYFYLPARGEHRGVGGVFFDDLTAPWAQAFAEDLVASALAEVRGSRPCSRGAH
jgi:coproporphyrinogen III oxidase